MRVFQRRITSLLQAFLAASLRGVSTPRHKFEALGAHARQTIWKVNLLLICRDDGLLQPFVSRWRQSWDGMQLILKLWSWAPARPPKQIVLLREFTARLRQTLTIEAWAALIELNLALRQELIDFDFRVFLVRLLVSKLLEKGVVSPLAIHWLVLSVLNHIRPTQLQEMGTFLLVARRSYLAVRKLKTLGFLSDDFTADRLAYWRHCLLHLVDCWECVLAKLILLFTCRSKWRQIQTLPLMLIRK